MQMHKETEKVKALCGLRRDRKMAAESERGSDEDRVRPGWGEWSLIKMFFN